ncbi:MAG TPA: nuclear transport factor 2 family protein [Sphingomonadaceae bacterium]|nr:nuclear transport factor 2 family protein [Sphingomonadaceae bacterium]
MAKARVSLLILMAAAAALPACAAARTAPAPSAASLSESEIAAIRQECETVSFRYAQYLDGKDWQHLPDVFAPDGVWEVLSNRMAGRDAIRDYWRARTADWAPTHGRLHQISNQVIDVIDRDHARGTSTVVVYFFDTAPGANKTLSPALIARNHDQFVRTPEGWKLQHRRIERLADLAQ